MDKDNIDYGVCGCSMCGIGIYDGIIVWVLKDGTKVNRFAGEDSHRERWIDAFIDLQLTHPDRTNSALARQVSRRKLAP